MTIKNLRNAGLLLLVALGLGGCLGGEAGSSSGATTPTTDTTTTTTTSKPTLSLELTSSLPATTDNTATTVIFGTPIYAVATVKDGSGAPVKSTVVSFASVSSMIVFSPASATALTDANGIASVKLDSSSIADAGATSIIASADVTTTSSGTSTTATYTSAPLGVALNASIVTLGALTVEQPLISAYGTSIVRAPVLINGAPTNSPMAVTFSSPCVTSGKATLSSPVTAVSGVATATYKDNNCASDSDDITASVSGASVSAKITVTPPAANNIQFVSATPSVIGIRGAGSPLPQNSIVKFKVVDNNNNAKAGVAVNFSLLLTNLGAGVTLSPASATTDANGEVTTSVTSGTVPTPVTVVATVSGSNPPILSQSNALSVTTGIPAQDFFSLSVQTHNIEGWSYDGITSALMVIVSDRLGNPAPDGTAINFITEGGQIVPPSCTTSNGTCSVMFKSAESRPRGEQTTNSSGAVVDAVAAVDDNGVPITDSVGVQRYIRNGRVTVLAYTVGEKSFLDANSNNIYDAGETFYDLGDPFIDSNENGIWDASPTQPNLREQFLNFAPVVGSSVACLTRNVSGGTAALPVNYANAPSKNNSCDGVWGKNYVRRSAVMVLSGWIANLIPQPLMDGLATVAPPSALTSTTFSFDVAAGSSKCGYTFYFWLMDENNNAMPAGTTVEVGSSSVIYTETGNEPTNATFTIGGTPVSDVTHPGGTRVDLIMDSGMKTCTGLGVYGGAVDMVIKTPLGAINHTRVVIQN